jgi:hypothetical protein
MVVDERSVEVVDSRGEPGKNTSAMDFSFLPVDATAASPLQVQGDEWDPHRVYFSEFLPGCSNAEKKKNGSTSDGISGAAPRSRIDRSTAKTKRERESSATASPSAFQPFNDDDGDDEDDKFKEAGVCPVLATGVGATMVDGGDNDALDPLGWPRQVPFLEAAAQQDIIDSGIGGQDERHLDPGFGNADGAGDEEDLLGPSHRSDYFVDDGASAVATEAFDSRDKAEGKEVAVDKRHRLKQYAKVEADEASLAANSSSSSDGDGSHDDDEQAGEEVGLEITYRVQDDDDDGDESDHDKDEILREEFQEMFAQLSWKARSDDNDDGSDRESERQQQSPLAFATFAPALVNADTDVPAFEVTWTDAESKIGENEAAISPTGGSGGEEEASRERKSVPLIKPPPEEKLRKWLRGKEQQS